MVLVREPPKSRISRYSYYSTQNEKAAVSSDLRELNGEGAIGEVTVRGGSERRHGLFMNRNLRHHIFRKIAVRAVTINSN